MPPLPVGENFGRLRLDPGQFSECLPQAALDTTVLLAAEVCGAPVAFLALRDHGSVRLCATFGLHEDNCPEVELPWGFWGEDGASHTVNNPTQHTGLAAAMQQLGTEAARFFACVPLLNAVGEQWGILAVLDRIPRELAARRIDILARLAAQVVAHMEYGQRMFHEGSRQVLASARQSPAEEEQQAQILRLQKQLEAQRTVDELTGVRNERVFRDRLIEEFERYSRVRHAFSLVLAEVDQHQTYRQRYGDDAYHHLLKRTAEVLLLQTRYCDIVARYGEDRFAIILLGTGSREAAGVIEKLATASIRAVPELRGHRLRFGAAHKPGTARTSQALIEECLQDLRQSTAPG